jgi:hypothetical protein
LKQRLEQRLAGFVIEAPEPLRLRLRQGQSRHLEIFTTDSIEGRIASRAVTEPLAIRIAASHDHPPLCVFGVNGV